MRHLIPFLLLAACAVPDNDPAPAPTLPDTCNVSRHIGLIGQPATALERVLIMDQVRVIRPDDMVTMDFRAERINFYISDGEVISDIRCG
ncbi:MULTISPECIES: I78 family peptidase inhibitor [unclassified Yoonia]|uniref:I78 family peptidase inhibitor n=1 Tax=unclassified Yoonia TaxID=2629118 RepID=UPI002AFEC7E5|nr:MULTISPECIES: I78 family peptidase inhibitor [unclassified Yoonia]